MRTKRNTPNFPEGGNPRLDSQPVSTVSAGHPQIWVPLWAAVILQGHKEVLV